MKMKRGKKGQIAVFVILAILILIVIIFLFIDRKDLTAVFGRESHVDKIEKCIKETAEGGIEILSLQGGSIDPKNFYLYEGNKVEYLCYVGENYKKCVMQKPMLKQNIEAELKRYIEPEVEECVESIKVSLEKKGYQVSTNLPEISIDIMPKNVIIDYNVELKIVKETTESYKSIKTSVDSNLYEFIMTTSSILNWEARYGDSETMNYMLYYPQLKVEKKTQGEGSKVYILTSRESGEKFMFAVRSIVFPPGLVKIRE